MRRIVGLLLLLTGLAPQTVAVAEGWKPITPALCDPRWAPSAVVLNDGKTALIAAGYSYATDRCLTTADIFDEKTLKFRPTAGQMTYPRDFATATTLLDGRVLIAGGFNTSLGSLNTAELYDPTTDQFTLLRSEMVHGRELYTATLLKDGRVLLVGGLDLKHRGTTASAELFDPATRTFSTVHSVMPDDRFGQNAVRLLDGRVLIAGGTHWRIGRPGKPLATAVLFDPVSNTFHPTRTPMSFPRDRPTTTLLADGTVLIAGGQNGETAPDFAESFDPETESFTKIPGTLRTLRMAHSDAILPDGRVLLTGGWAPLLKLSTNTTDIYDPVTHVFTIGPPLPDASHDHALLTFSDGDILICAGKQVSSGAETSLSTAAIWLSTGK